MKILALSFLSLLPTFACSGGSTSNGLPEEFSVLVPSDAIALVQIRSLEELAERAERLRVFMDPEGIPYTAHRIATDLLLTSGFAEDALSLLDPRRPVAIALTLDTEAAFPVRRVFLLPTRDPDALAGRIRENGEGLETVIEGHYLAAHLDGWSPATPGTCRLLASMPDGVVSAQADLGGLVEQYGPMLQLMLGGVESQIRQELLADGPTQGAAYMVGAFVQFARDAVESADLLTLAVEAEGRELSFDLSLNLKPDSPLTGWAQSEQLDYDEWIRCLDPDAGFLMISSFRMATWIETFGVLYDELLASAQADPEIPPEATAALGAYFDGLRRFYGATERLALASFDHGADGMRWAVSIEAEDPATAEALFSELLHAPELAALGIVGSDPVTTRLAGLPATTWRQKFDFMTMMSVMEPENPTLDDPSFERVLSAMFGDKEEAILTTTRGDDRFHLLLGADDAWREAAARRLVSGGDPSAGLERLAAKLGGADPGGLISLDLLFYLDVLMPFVQELEAGALAEQAFGRMRNAAGDSPLRFDCYWGATADGLRAGLSLDLERTFRMIAAAEVR